MNRWQRHKLHQQLRQAKRRRSVLQQEMNWQLGEMTPWPGGGIQVKTAPCNPGRITELQRELSHVVRQIRALEQELRRPDDFEDRRGLLFWLVVLPSIAVMFLWEQHLSRRRRANRGS